MNRVKMAEYLAKKRKDMGLTQTELGEILHISYQAISRWENGENLPDIQCLEELSKLYNVTIEEILNGEEKKNENTLINVDVEKKKDSSLEAKNNNAQQKNYLNNKILRVVLDGVFFLILLIVFALPFIYAKVYVGSYEYVTSFAGYDLIFKTHAEDFIAFLVIIPTILGMFFVPLTQVILSICLFATKKESTAYKITLAQYYIRVIFLIMLALLSMLLNMAGGYIIYVLLTLALSIVYFTVKPLRPSYFNVSGQVKRKSIFVYFIIDALCFILTFMLIVISTTNYDLSTIANITFIFPFSTFVISTILYILPKHRRPLLILNAVLRFIFPVLYFLLVLAWNIPGENISNFTYCAIITILELVHAFSYVVAIPLMPKQQEVFYKNAN